MNKKDFLKELEKRLDVLDEKEINDIISEYRDIIEEKVKNGKTEEEAVNEFGSIDELVTEILKAYKINPKYSNNKDNFREASKSFESWIKDAAQSLSDVAKGIYSNISKDNKDISIEMVFELIIKFIIMLIILAVLRLPFEIINGLGNNIFNMAFFPFDTAFNIIWHIFTSILYFGVCVLVFIAMFKEYVDLDKKSNYKQESKRNYKKKEVNNKFERQENEKSESQNSRINNSSNNVTTFFSIVYKFFMVIFFLIPLWFFQIGLVIALGVVIYYAIIGINIWGLAIILLGLSIGTGWITNIFSQLTFRIQKVHFYPALTSAVVICIGCLIFANNIMTFDYIDSIPSDVTYQKVTKSKNFTLTTLGKIEDQDNNIKYYIDSKLKDNVVKVEYSYFSDLQIVSGITLNYDTSANEYTIGYLVNNYNNFNNIKKGYNMVISNLKDGKVYDYSKLNDITIRIYANKSTLDKIK